MYLPISFLNLGSFRLLVDGWRITRLATLDYYNQQNIYLDPFDAFDVLLYSSYFVHTIKSANHLTIQVENPLIESFLGIRTEYNQGGWLGGFSFIAAKEQGIGIHIILTYLAHSQWLQRVLIIIAV